MSNEPQSSSTSAFSTASTALTNGTSPTTDQALASGKFRKLISAIKECAKYQAIYSDIEGTQDRLSRVELDAMVKDAEIQKQKESYDRLMDTHEVRTANWLAEKKALESEKKNLEETLKELEKEKERLKDVVRTKGTEVENMKKELKAEKRRGSGLKNELDQVKKTVEELNASLKTCEMTVREWESYGETLHDVDIGGFSSDMNKLSARFQKFAEKYFLVDVSTGLLREHAEWDNLVATLQLSPGVPPLPPQNSDAAKQARMAAALAVLAVHLARYIFAPIYIPVENDGIRELLMQHADVDSKREAACRGLLLLAYKEDDERQAAEKLVLEITDRVSKLLGALLNPDVVDAFRTELDALLRDATILWSHAQHSTVKIEASAEDAENWEWNELDIFENTGEGAASDPAVIVPTPRSFGMLTLFPRVFIVHEDEWELVFPGIALWDWQTAAAEQELRECMAARRPRVGGGSRSGRRISIVDGGGGARARGV